MMLIAATPTGRKFGDTVEPSTTSVKIAGVDVTVVASDSWEGGDGPDGNIVQEYWRCVWLVAPVPRCWREKPSRVAKENTNV